MIKLVLVTVFAPFEFVAVSVTVYFPGIEKLTSGNLDVLVVPFINVALFGDIDQDQAFG